jgi:transposase
MRFYNQAHRFYAGGDLHARTLYLHALDDQGKTRFQQNLQANPATFLQAIEPFRNGFVVGVECLFTWYWLADLCEDQGIPFVLGHALYMKAIHGGKTKKDKIDAAKIATNQVRREEPTA